MCYRSRRGYVAPDRAVCEDLHVSSTESPRRTILVVDDERIVALELQHALAVLGFLVPATAASCADALALAEVNPPQIVLMDLHLRGPVDGIDTARQLRERFDFGLVYMTGGVDAAQRARASATNPAAWLQKPYTQLQLEQALRVAEAKLRPQTG